MNFRALIPPRLNGKGYARWVKFVAWLATVSFFLCSAFYYVLGTTHVAIQIRNCIWPEATVDEVAPAAPKIFNLERRERDTFSVKVVDAYRRPMPHVGFEFTVDDPSRVYTNSLGYAVFDTDAMGISATMIGERGEELARIAELKPGRIVMPASRSLRSREWLDIEGPMLDEEFSWEMLPKLTIESESDVRQKNEDRRLAPPFQQVDGETLQTSSQIE